MTVPLAATASPPQGGPAAAAARSSCTCYYGYDEECPRKFVCEGNFTGADKCIRMQPKGGLMFGFCGIRSGTGDQDIAPCDATCVPEEEDTQCALDDFDAVAESLGHWAEAMTQPVFEGGGTFDDAFAAQARGVVSLSAACAEYLGWRVLGVMELCRGNDFVTHPDDNHELDDHVLSDLSGDPCRVASGYACVDAIVQGMQDPASVDPILDGIADQCPDGLPFGQTGLEDAPLDGVKERIRTTIRHLDIMGSGRNKAP